jgi:hypothetical protein
MHHIPTTATAVEKLKRAAKGYRDIHGCLLAHALDAVAVQGGYADWKHVTVCAEATPGRDPLLPAKHRHLLTYAEPRAEVNRLKRVTSVEELCDMLGGIQPYFARQRCDQGPAGQHCLCELDPFATSMQNNVLVDLGDKYDGHSLLFMHSRPAREYDSAERRRYFGLATSDVYPNEHLTMRSNRDRSNALNPNNPAHQASLDNRSMQLDPQNRRFAPGGESRD